MKNLKKSEKNIDKMDHKELIDYIKSIHSAYDILWKIFRATMNKIIMTRSLAEAKHIAREALVVLRQRTKLKK